MLARDRVLIEAQHVAKFFSNEVTHFITNQPIPSPDDDANKENAPKEKPGLQDLLKSPIKLRERYVHISTYNFSW